MEAKIRITAIFEALGTTPNAFAVAHGLSAPALYGFVNGSRSPSFDTLVTMCKAEPRISAEYLLRGEGSVLRDLKKMLSISGDTIQELRDTQEHINQFIEGRIQEIAEQTPQA